MGAYLGFLGVFGNSTSTRVHEGLGGGHNERSFTSGKWGMRRRWISQSFVQHGFPTGAAQKKGVLLLSTIDYDCIICIINPHDDERE